MTFELTLKNSKLRSYHLIGWLFLFFNLIALVYFSLSKVPQDRFFAAGLFVVALLTAFIAWKKKIRGLRPIDYAGILYLLISALWLKWKVYGAVAANGFLFVLYHYSIRKLEVLISSGEIVYPSFPKRKIRWSELQNMIVKDGLLTIDFKNNKLLQNEVAGTDRIDENKINEFCREQLTK